MRMRNSPFRDKSYTVIPRYIAASPIGALLFRGIFHSAFFTVNSDWLMGVTVFQKFITIKKYCFTTPFFKLF